MCRETDEKALAAKILAQLAGGLAGSTGEAVRSFFASISGPVCTVASG